MKALALAGVLAGIAARRSAAPGGHVLLGSDASTRHPRCDSAAKRPECRAASRQSPLDGS